MTSYDSHGVSNLRHFDYLFDSSFRVTSRKTSKLHIADPLWGESTSGQWTPLTKCQLCGKRLQCHHHAGVMMTSSNGNIFCVTGPLRGEFTGPGEFPKQRPVTRIDVFFDLRLNKRLSKQPWGWWFEAPSWSLWRQCNGNEYDVTPHISSCQIGTVSVWKQRYLWFIKSKAGLFCDDLWAKQCI